MKNFIVVGLALGSCFIANTAYAYQNTTGTVTDHYKTVIDRTPYSVEVCTHVEVDTKPKLGGLDVEGMIVGGIIGNQIGDSKGNGAAGALLGGLFANQDEKTLQRKCSTETRYNEVSKEMYSHSTITFADNGKDYKVTFQK